MFSRKCTLFAFSAIAAVVAVAALLHDPSLAAKPGGGGGGSNTGGGTIYFVSDGFRQMNSGGSGKTLLPIPSGEPSRLMHAGHRWFLRVNVVPGVYPDGGQRNEIFAYRDDGVSFPLTNDSDLEPANRTVHDVRWQAGDVSISWVAQRWDSETGEVVEAGIYEALLVYDGSGNLAGIAPLSVLLILPVSDIGTHDWSPDGTRIVYDQQTTNELWIADLVTDEVNLLHSGPANLAVWSPDGTRIAFHEAVFLGDLMTIKPDGTSLARIIQSHGGKAVSVNIPHWSPSGSHLIYQQWHHNGFDATSYVYRARADGSGKSNLTSDIGFATPIGWR